MDHHSHSSTVFKQKVLVSVLLMVLTVVFSPTVQGWVGLNEQFSGSSYLAALFGTTLFFYGGLVFIKGALQELRHKRPGMMTLISLAIVTAFLYSCVVTLRLVEGMDFWWELATLITIMLIGHWIEMTAIDRAQGSLKGLARLLPDTAERLEGGVPKEVAVHALQLGDSILVRPGSRIAVDGEVIEGASDVDESMITGESKLIKKIIGSPVIGGTVNERGALTVRVTKIGDDTVLAGIMHLIAQAQKSKSNTQILADKAAFYLTYIALGVALIAGVAWLLLGASAAFALERVVTVLVVACPHALGLAIPLVVAISTTRAARYGILVRSRSALELAKDVDTIIFDKTGTLTEGRQGVVDVISESKNTPVLALAAAAESASEHLIAKAIVRSADEHGIDRFRATEFVALPGRGVQATVHGRIVYVGSHRLVTELAAHIPPMMTTAARRATMAGKTVVYVIEAGRVSGVIVLADIVRKESYLAVKTLQQQGKRVVLLSGDNNETTEWVSRDIGILEYYGEILPQDKVATVERFQKAGSRVAMIGDGVNDAAALTKADVGMAIGGGTDVAVASAGIILVSDDPRNVAKVLTLSNATYKKMKQNLFWATAYNVAVIPLAAGLGMGYGIVISPAVGAVLMSVSTVIVAFNAQLLRKTQL